MNSNAITITVPPVRHSWVCLRCQASNAPHVDRCVCLPEGAAVIGIDVLGPLSGFDWTLDRWPMGDDKPSVITDSPPEFTLTS